MTWLQLIFKKIQSASSGERKEGGRKKNGGRKKLEEQYLIKFLDQAYI